jgi:hypothetical protein
MEFLIILSVIILFGWLWYYAVEGYKYSDAYQRQQIESNQTDIVHQSDRIGDMENRLNRLEQKVDAIARHIGIDI